MPGIAHLIYGFSLALVLRWATDDKFSIQHSFVFGVNTWVGPDIGATLWFFTQGMNETFSEYVLLLIHNPYNFPLTMGLPLAYLWRYLTKLSTKKENGKLRIDKLKKPKLSLFQCFVLITAGSYAHFLFDYVFDCNGYGSTYRWVLSTGSWNGTAYFDGWIIIPALLTTLFIIFFLYLNNPPHKELFTHQIKNTALLLIIFSSLYLLYLYIRLQIGIPAIGEEADFGVVLFSSIFLIFPLFLCVLSYKDLSMFKERFWKRHKSKEPDTEIQEN